MRNLLCILALCMAAICQAQISSQDFFKLADDASENLPSDKLFPQGRLLPMSLYSVGSPEIERSKQDGFTAIGPYYGDQKNVISQARKNGVHCFYSVGNKIRYKKDPNAVTPPDEEIRRIVTQQVKAVADNQEIAVWNLANEELRYWRPEEMRWLRVASKAVHDTDPMKRPVFMYEPSHRTAAALVKTVTFLDICGKGSYVNYLDDSNSSSFKQNRIWLRWSIEQEIKAIKDTNSNAAPYAVLWMAKDPRSSDDVAKIPSWCRHDVYLSLVSGAKGVLIWSGYNKRRGFEKTFTDYYEGYASCTRQLNGELKLGEVFLFGQKKDDISVTVTSNPSTLLVSYRGANAAYSSVSFANIAYGTDRYLFLVNSAQTQTTVHISGLPQTKVLKQNVFESSKAKLLDGGQFDIDLMPLDVKCFKFSNEE